MNEYQVMLFDFMESLPLADNLKDELHKVVTYYYKAIVIPAIALPEMETVPDEVAFNTINKRSPAATETGGETFLRPLATEFRVDIGVKSTNAFVGEKILLSAAAR
ncbi:hypothetical protein [Lysinibacillus xylanilyticus]|uniref:hypothetical protein n=1 Tax=Lysinibacillus xylanilyticus TaxID=582475 RepID=UPI003811DFB2